jgi:hypothetical protein
MKFIPIQKAAGLNFTDNYLVELKDGTHALGQLVSVQKEHKTFKVINFNEGDADLGTYSSWETADVVKVAKLPRKGQVEEGEQKDPAV